MHTVIKDRHKKLVKAAVAQDSRHVVEVRKLKKRYADFIKTSQFFYKGYIQRLASKYCGLKGLRRIAHRLSLETLSAEDPINASSELQQLIDASCYATLLHLGDLSRYRNEIRTKDRSWEPALGYYNLASNLCPDNGSAHNQVAVIALSEQNHLDAVYNLYRAIAIQEPYPLAKGNLEIEFKKIATAWERKPVFRTKLGGTETLILWFVRLHARFYKGVEFSTQHELEQTVLTGLTRLLDNLDSEIILEKFVIINIAAEYCAAERSIQSSSFLLRFNIRMISTLLEKLKPELETPVIGEELPNNSAEPPSTKSKGRKERISSIARRILPALRQYSTWLVSRSAAIAAAPDRQIIAEVWQTYAQVMTKIAILFPVEELATVGYLLEEDEMTIGFKPLRDPKLNAESNLYVGDDGLMKSRLTDPGVERNHPTIEMVSRIRDIILCALTLYAEQKAPIDLVAPAFIYDDKILVRTSTSDLESSISQSTLGNFDTTKESATKSPIHTATILAESVAASDSHHSMDTDMHRMVDDLLEPSTEYRPTSNETTSNETSYGMHSLTANDIFAPMCSIVAPQHNSPKMLPSLPGIWQNPFTPQPNELSPASPNRPLTAHDRSPGQLSNAEQQFASSSALHELITGDGNVAPGSWGRKILQAASISKTQPVSQLLHETLSQQYGSMAMASSAFTDSSSIYANNTPRAAWNNHAFANGNNTTVYAGASDFDRTTMLQSSVWDGSQPLRGGYVQTPPSGQGG